ncbi:MAG: hypothetical protein LBH25_01895 [Fibromonadaceae bacterium]|jgi:hypothetical protein|nr:hypothetical protein [Fibromonadaceae bacterium]
MEKLKAVLLIYVSCSLTGCFIFDECFAVTECNTDEKLPAYANKSGETIEISYRSGSLYKKSIANEDTLHSSFYYKENRKEWDIPNEADCGIAADDDCDRPVRMQLRFLNVPQKCLIFEGPIEHDGIDMRSWDSYKRGNKVSGWADFWVGVEYVYTITPQHREMAREEDCPRF